MGFFGKRGGSTSTQLYVTEINKEGGKILKNNKRDDPRLLESGMYPQGRAVRPRSHLNFQMP